MGRKIGSNVRVCFKNIKIVGVKKEEGTFNYVWVCIHVVNLRLETQYYRSLYRSEEVSVFQSKVIWLLSQSAFTKLLFLKLAGSETFAACTQNSPSVGDDAEGVRGWGGGGRGGGALGACWLWGRIIAMHSFGTFLLISKANKYNLDKGSTSREIFNWWGKTSNAQFWHSWLQKVLHARFWRFSRGPVAFQARR